MSDNNKKIQKKPTGLIRAAKVEQAGNKSEIQAQERSQDRAYWLYNFTLGYIPYKKQKASSVARTIRIGGKERTFTILGHPKYGLPYGKIPRMIILYFITQAKMGNKQMDVANVSQFMRDLGLPIRGEYIKRVKEELIKLNYVRYIIEDNNEERYTSSELTITNSTFFQINWLESPNDPKTINNKTLPLWNNGEDMPEGDYIRLDNDFYDHVQKHAFPVDKAIIKVLSQSSLAFEIYLFLTYNYNKNFKLTWAELFERFGMGFKTDKHGRYNFKRNFRKQFALVKAAYKGNNSKLVDDGLLILQSVPSVRAKKTKKAVEFSNDNLSPNKGD